MSNQEQQTKRPVESFSVGGLSVSLWENEREGGNGVQKSVSVRKSYYNRETQKFEEKTMSLNATEVSAMARLLAKMEQAVISSRLPF